MTIPEYFRFTVRGFSAKRFGYALGAMSFSFVPVHFYVPCQVSGLVAGFGIILFFSTAVLSASVPQGTPHRFRPMALAFIAVVAHSLCTH